MRKGILSVLVCLSVVLCACSSAGSPNLENTASFSADAGASMDFSAPLPLKLPKGPIEKDPCVLFVGNTLTSANNMPEMFLKLSESGGKTPMVKSLTENAYRLEFFADPSDALGKELSERLKETQYDYVVLQEQSRLPTLGNLEKTMYPYARALDKQIQESGAQTVFLMTWAYAEGDNLNEYGIPLITTKEEMQAQLAQSYFEISQELDAFLAPAGIAFMRCNQHYADIALWNKDKVHPSLAGSYLTACVLYALLYHESPLGLSYLGGLSEYDAVVLQNIAFRTVLPS